MFGLAITLSTDENILFLAVSPNPNLGPATETNITIFNVSGHSTYNIINSFPVKSGLLDGVEALTTSSDNTKLFILTSGALQIVDITILTSIECCVSSFNSFSTIKRRLVLSKNDDILFMIARDGRHSYPAMVADIADPNNPIILSSDALSSTYSIIFTPMETGHL